MENDRIKWNERYTGEGFFIGPHPSRYLADYISLIESLVPGKKALDIACGEGRNSIFLARRGFAVTGLDIAEQGLVKAEQWAAREGLRVIFRQADLENFEFAETYDLIINFNFLLRDLIPKMVAALNPGGVIVFETILDSPTLVGFHKKAFLLQPGELAGIFGRFPGKAMHAEECTDGPSPAARLIFQLG
jgi:2-polyprenyl-3-methyl-5-hydroxy-6-metoxy-1,4-benzoquinol methylase